MKNTTLCLLFLAFIQVCAAQESQQTDSTKKKNKYIPKISGMLQVHYLAEFNTNGDTIRDPAGFRILRARLEAKGYINKYISYQIMIDPRAPEQGGILRDAYMEFHIIKNQDIRVGQQKTQFCYENPESIAHLYTVNRAEMSDGVSRGENLRDIGIGILGHIDICEHVRFEDAVTFTNGTKFNVEGPYDFNSNKAVWGRLGGRYKNDNLSIRLGGSFGFGGLRYLGDTLESPTDDEYADFRRLGVDVQVDHKYFFFFAEYAMGTDKFAVDSLNEEPFGYQAMLAIKTKWKIGPLFRYDVFEDEWKVMTCGAYYGLPKDKFRILVNYIFRGNIKDIPEGHDDRLYIQGQIVF